jgi:hypothetical protein
MDEIAGEIDKCAEIYARDKEESRDNKLMKVGVCLGIKQRLKAKYQPDK